MSIYAISDLHLSAASDKPMDIFGGSWIGYMEEIERDWRRRVLPSDVVLLPGDLSWGMTMEQAMPDIERVNALPGKKVLIRGNHDYWWSSISRLREKLPQGMYAVQNDALKIGGAVVCGSRGWTVADGEQQPADKKIYERELLRMEMSLQAAMRLRTDGEPLIVLIHYPPFNVRRERSGFSELFEKYCADKVVYGHLHGRDCRSDLKLCMGGVEYYLTSCDLTANKMTLICK